jgi:hypothetical protein
MSAFKIVQKIAKVSGTSTSDPISLQSGYLRIIPEADAYVEIGYTPTISTSTSLWLKAGEIAVIKEPVRSQPVVGVSTGTTTTISLPGGTGSCVSVGDYVALTGIQPAGINTTFAQVSSVLNTDPRNGYQSDRIVLNWNTSSITGVITATSSAEIRKAVKVATNSSGVTHITEVQITNSL